MTIATPLTRALAALENSDRFMDLVEQEGYMNTCDVFDQLFALSDVIYELMLTPGTKVRMNDACHAAMAKSSGAHLVEFWGCIGIVEGPVDYTGPSCQIKQFGPEVDVRWQPSNLRYAYKPEHLEIVQ